MAARIGAVGRTHMPITGSIASVSNPAAYLAAIVESSDDAIISKDLDGIITSWNHGAERIFGYRAAEAIGQSIMIIVPPDRRAEEIEILAKLRRGERINHFETVRLAKDAREIQLSVTISPIRDESRKIIGASNVARDITNQKKLEAKLRRTNRELEDIAHIASHDLKEPLRGLIMKASFLREDYADRLDEDGREELDGLVNLAHRSYHLINDLLNISRAGRRDFAIGEVDVHAIVDDITRLLDERLRERNARVVVHERLPRFRGDRHTFTEVFRNLITNAILYNDKPDPMAEIGFLREKFDGPNIEKNVFYVKDNGIGIDKKLHGEVFRMFKRLVVSKKYNESGTGVGLTLVKQMVERCGGRVWLESEPGQGSTFYFTMGECSTLTEEKPMVDQLSKSAEEEAQLRKQALESNRTPAHGAGDRNIDGIEKEKEGGDEQDTADAVLRPGPNTRPYRKSTDISNHGGA